MDDVYISDSNSNIDNEYDIYEAYQKSESTDDLFDEGV